MSLTLVVAIPGPEESALVHAFADPALGVVVVRRAADLAEVLAIAGSGRADVALTDLSLRDLDRDAVATIRAAGCAVVAFARRPEDARIAGNLGISRSVLAGDSPEDIAAQLSAEVAQERAPEVRDAAPPLPIPAAGTGPAAPSVGQGRLVAFWSPAGSAGRSSLLAAAGTVLGRAGRDVLLLDADTIGPSLAQILGVLDEAPGLVAAARAAAHGTLDERVLADLAPFVTDHVRLLTGIATASRWPEVRQSSYESVLVTARRLAPLVLADLGGSLEEDEDLSYDTLAPRRNATTTVTLREADHVVAVVRADPIGVTRLLKAADDLLEIARAPVTVVLNRSRSTRTADDLADLIRRHTGLTQVLAVPEDASGFAGALWEGRSVAEYAPRSAAVGAVRDLVEIAAPVPAAAPAAPSRPSRDLPDPRPVRSPRGRRRERKDRRATGRASHRRDAE